MSIRAIITGGIGPGGSVKYALTRGYDIGAAIIIPICYQDASATMRNALVVVSALSNTAVSTSGTLSNTTVSTQSDLC